MDPIYVRLCRGPAGRTGADSVILEGAPNAATRRKGTMASGELLLLVREREQSSKYRFGAPCPPAAAKIATKIS